MTIIIIHDQKERRGRFKQGNDQRELDGRLLEMRKKQNVDTLSDGFGSSDRWGSIKRTAGLMSVMAKLLINESIIMNGGGGVENGGDNGGNGVLGNDQEIVDQELGDHNGGGGEDDVQGVPVAGVGGGLVRGGDAMVPGVVDHDRPFILALVLPVDVGYDRPIVLVIPAQRGGLAGAVYGPMLHLGIGGGVLQPGGGGEIPIANATHANYFPRYRSFL
nr:hypothetical protein [Tanacetum cinerariifolium]